MARANARTNDALREVRSEIEFRRSELAALERAADILARADAIDPARCDLYQHAAPCEGAISMRWCRCCGVFVVRRCIAHGGVRSAGAALDKHAAEHGGEYARGATAHE